MTVTTGTLAAPGVRLFYEVRGSGPLVALVGSPMHSEPFAPLADLLAADHTVLTTDPRGHFGSVLDDPDTDSTPELRADDLARLIRHLDAGPATVFGSSGGAITTLALLQADPELVRTAIAHEPPLAELLDEREQQRALRADLSATYRAGDRLGAIRKFIAMTEMAMPEELFEQMFTGERSAAEADSERYFYLHELEGTAGWVPDLAALRRVSDRLVIGIGDESAGQFCDRTSRALGGALGIEPTLFPGDHVGFIAEPAKFAARLREVTA
ncbi:alpha/beta fold hydrolase [Nocardia transvalensis]|uniref:alpha/beta fold hydrolase n=1 Tax=Nocardia transvalensis TaxID=37333 RepID=UPI0018944A00|nr:alpha/beta hydrolase [Nocardia transvalensis]MBF6328137.1 alpha/beta hydrolase [Nocardia transvalensis]